MVRLIFLIMCVLGIFGDHAFLGLIGLFLLWIERDE